MTAEDLLRAEIVKALDGHTQWSRDCHLSGEYLCDKVWPLVNALQVRLTYWEKEAAAHDERACRAEADLTAAEAERDKLKADLSVAVIEIGAQARARGEAEGVLRASNLAGMVEGWQSRAYAAEAEVERVTAERDEAREAVALCNNSFGYQAYFLKPHPAEKIEELKANSNAMWRRATAAEAEVERLKQSIRDLEGKAQLARMIYESEKSAIPTLAASAFGVLEEFARSALSFHEPQKGEDHG